MQSKQQTREQLQADIIAFLAKGGHIQQVKAKKIPVNRKVTA